MITLSNQLDAILDAAYGLPTGITIDSIEEPGGRRDEYRVVLLDSIGGAKQTVRIDPFASAESVGRLLRDAARALFGKPRSNQKRKRT
jgi:hypothetical protein